MSILEDGLLLTIHNSYYFVFDYYKMCLVSIDTIIMKMKSNKDCWIHYCTCKFKFDIQSCTKWPLHLSYHFRVIAIIHNKKSAWSTYVQFSFMSNSTFLHFSGSLLLLRLLFGINEEWKCYMISDSKKQYRSVTCYLSTVTLNDFSVPVKLICQALNLWCYSPCYYYK